ncbi:MAG: VWA domain-containing protein [Thermoanaerobaculia bacterium]|nr:VWA domain-containing protein [Thermoanaerobaculia bacterium]
MDRSVSRGRVAFVTLVVLALQMVLAAQVPGKKKDDDELSRKERKQLTEALPQRYQDWLQDVDWLLSDAERDAFLQLQKDYLRDAFIEEFWTVRDPYPDTGRNEFRDDYQNRLETVRQSFGRFDDRAKVLLSNGWPAQRIEVKCSPHFVPMEVWHYDGSENVHFEFLLLFFKKWGVKDYRLWDQSIGFAELSDDGTPFSSDNLRTSCPQSADAVLAALSFLNSQGQMGSMMILADILSPQKEPPAQEWVATFNSYTSELPEGALTFEADLDVSYPGRRQSRTILQGNLVVTTANIAAVNLTGGGADTADAAAALGLAPTYNLSLTGEILREGKLFDNFRYEYDFPVADFEGVADAKLPLVFQRYLRPGDYTLMVKVEDLGTGKFHRTEQAIDVPSVDHPPQTEPADPETARILEEANRAIRSGETTVQIPPLFGEWQTGLVRIEAVITGDVDHVTFLLDDRPILTKKRPPFNVELDLGDVPRPRVLRVEAKAEDGTELAADERMLNTGTHRFAVRLEEPRSDRRYRRSLRAEADVVVPKSEVVERVEFYMNETKVSTLYQEPWIQPVLLPQGESISYVRAVAFTPDGRTAEDTVFVNAPDNFEYIDVDFVELYTLVLDKENRPMQGLQLTDFSVLEDGVAQDVVRFEKVENLPIHAAILLDVSASMENKLKAAQEAALHFFRQAITPKDRATTITFNDHPNLTVDFTNDIEQLAGGLAGVKAERGTALYDSLIFALYYFNGLSGQRAILLLSDGQDESSKFEFDDVLEYAQRSGVSIYSVGLQLDRGEGGAKRKLERLSDETGGRAFFIEDPAQLSAVYDTIQMELRSRYLLAYQSSNTSDRDVFRSIQVVMGGDDLEAKTLRGYYP